MTEKGLIPNIDKQLIQPKGLPRWFSGKESAYSAGDAEGSFNPWARKIPWRKKWQPTPVFLLGYSDLKRGIIIYNCVFAWAFQAAEK